MRSTARSTGIDAQWHMGAAARPPRSVCLVANPAAGGGRAAGRVRDAVAALRSRGFEVTLRVTKRPGDAHPFAGEILADTDAIAVLGGDGTVNDVIQGMAGQAYLWASSPGGTVNVLAIELGLPFALEDACAIIAAGRRTTMDLGSLNGRRFALHAGAGLDALTVREVRGDAKRRFRELAFVAAGLSAIRHHPQPPFRVIVDGRKHYATFCVVANCGAYAGRRLRIAPEADPADGVFDVVLFRGWGFADTAAFWLGLTTGTHPYHPGTETIREAGACGWNRWETGTSYGSRQTESPPGGLPQRPGWSREHSTSSSDRATEESQEEERAYAQARQTGRSHHPGRDDRGRRTGRLLEERHDHH